jgi:hypothetical protein
VAQVEASWPEALRLHRVPDALLTTMFGETRKVMWDSTISVGGVRYSVPCGLIDEQVAAAGQGVQRGVGDRADPQTRRLLLRDGVGDPLTDRRRTGSADAGRWAVSGRPPR